MSHLRNYQMDIDVILYRNFTQNLLNEFTFCSHPLNTTPTLHRAEIQLYKRLITQEINTEYEIRLYVSLLQKTFTESIFSGWCILQGKILRFVSGGDSCYVHLYYL